MYIDEALTKVLSTLDTIMIPMSESAKAEAVKAGINSVIHTVRSNRAKAQREAEQAAAQSAAVKEDNHDEA